MNRFFSRQCPDTSIFIRSSYVVLIFFYWHRQYSHYCMRRHLARLLVHFSMFPHFWMHRFVEWRSVIVTPSFLYFYKFTIKIIHLWIVSLFIEGIIILNKCPWPIWYHNNNSTSYYNLWSRTRRHDIGNGGSYWPVTREDCSYVVEKDY